MNTKIVFILGTFITFTVETGSSSAESSIYGLKGASITFTVEDLKHLQIRRITWRFKNINILEYTPGDNKVLYFQDYEKKTEFESTDFSLLLKNLAETDQGIYIANIDDKSGVLSEKKYRLHVQEAVSKPVIWMKSLSLSSAEGFCNVSVNCSVRHSWASYTCDQTQCSQTEPQSWPDVNITVTVYNGRIICTGSNRVSNETQSEPLGHACQKTDSSSGAGLSWSFWLILGTVLCIVCPCVVWFVRRRNSICESNSEGVIHLDGVNTEYMAPPTTNGALLPNAHQDNTVYCTVGHPKDLPPRTPPPAHCDETSIYSQVKK